MKTATVEIVNRLGLHARAATRLVKTASSFSSTIMLIRNDKRINGKSIMGVLTLAAAKGCTLTIEAEGPDEQDALDTLVQLIANRFGEDE